VPRRSHHQRGDRPDDLNDIPRRSQDLVQLLKNAIPWGECVDYAVLCSRLRCFLDRNDGLLLGLVRLLFCMCGPLTIPLSAEEIAGCGERERLDAADCFQARRFRGEGDPFIVELPRLAVGTAGVVQCDRRPAVLPSLRQRTVVLY
jgi:hypothetical protein